MTMEDGIAQDSPMKLFNMDLISLIKGIEENLNNYIILRMDSNESINDKEGGMYQLLQKAMLADTFLDSDSSFIRLQICWKVESDW